GLRAVAELIDHSHLEGGPPPPPPDLLAVAERHLRQSCLELLRALYSKGNVAEKDLLLQLWPEEAAKVWPEEAHKPSRQAELVAQARKGLSPELLAQASRLRAATSSHGETAAATFRRLCARLRQRESDTNRELERIATEFGVTLYRICR